MGIISFLFGKQDPLHQRQYWAQEAVRYHLGDTFLNSSDAKREVRTNVKRVVERALADLHDSGQNSVNRKQIEAVVKHLGTHSPQQLSRLRLHDVRLMLDPHYTLPDAGTKAHALIHGRSAIEERARMYAHDEIERLKDAGASRGAIARRRRELTQAYRAAEGYTTDHTVQDGKKPKDVFRRGMDRHHIDETAYVHNRQTLTGDKLVNAASAETRRELQEVKYLENTISERHEEAVRTRRKEFAERTKEHSARETATPAQKARFDKLNDPIKLREDRRNVRVAHTAGMKELKERDTRFRHTDTADTKLISNERSALNKRQDTLASERLKYEKARGAHTAASQNSSHRSLWQRLTFRNRNPEQKLAAQGAALNRTKTQLDSREETLRTGREELQKRVNATDKKRSDHAQQIETERKRLDKRKARVEARVDTQATRQKKMDGRAERILARETRKTNTMNERHERARAYEASESRVLAQRKETAFNNKYKATPKRMPNEVAWYMSWRHPRTPIRGAWSSAPVYNAMERGAGAATGFLKGGWKVAKWSGIGLAGLAVLNMFANNLKGSSRPSAGGRDFADNTGLDDIPQLLDLNGPKQGYAPEQWQSMETARRHGMPTGLEAALNPKMRLTDNVQDMGAAAFQK